MSLLCLRPLPSPQPSFVYIRLPSSGQWCPHTFLNVRRLLQVHLPLESPRSDVHLTPPLLTLRSPSSSPVPATSSASDPRLSTSNSQGPGGSGVPRSVSTPLPVQEETVEHLDGTESSVGRFGVRGVPPQGVPPQEARRGKGRGGTSDRVSSVSHSWPTYSSAIYVLE